MLSRGSRLARRAVTMSADDAWGGYARDHITGLCRPFLVARGGNGFLACGYVSAAACTKTGDAVAVFRGVGSHDDMLAAEVKDVSEEAAAFGVEVGMLGREAVEKLRGSCDPPPTPPPKTFPEGTPLMGLTGYRLPGLNHPFLVLQGSKGFLASGYVCPTGTSGAGDAAAVFADVSDHYDFVQSPVTAVSAAGEALGIKVGMSGCQAGALIR
eukprot:TRINITY_DN6438_c0_g1_i1.p1 TRINITY_DN6438_c0_g1~~TRINITY_DN6438_c0_g1_i1.p1  ORF type:complete len:212 (+),score=66.23 TRINITY_DN6438_c0_g1_i1:407-1042(+)